MRVMRKPIIDVAASEPARKDDKNVAESEDAGKDDKNDQGADSKKCVISWRDEEGGEISEWYKHVKFTSILPCESG